MADCVSRVVGETGISREDAAAVLGHVRDGGKRSDYEKRLTFIQQKEMANVAMNAVKRGERRKLLAGAPSPEAGMRALLVGSNEAFAGSRLSTEAMVNGNKQVILSAFARDLQDGGVEEVFANGSLEIQWARELYELNRKGDKGKPGVTGNKQALRIAEAVQRMQKAGVELVNREGGFVVDYDGYVAKTVHNPTRLIEMGPDKWMDLAERTFDLDRMYPGISDASLKKTLRGMYDELKLGRHYEFGDDGVFIPKGANIARRVSESRTVHFASAEKWLEYIREASDQTPSQIVLASALRAARDAGLMRVWGTNPRNAFERDLGELIQATSNAGDNASLAALQDREKTFQDWFSIMDGSAMRVTNKGKALILQNYLAIQRSAKLGMLPFAQLADLATISGELKYQGVGFGERMLGAATAYFRGDSSQQREVARLVGAGIEGWLSEISAHLELLDPQMQGGNFTGAVSAIQNFMFRWSGAQAMTNRAREAGVYMMGAWFGGKKHLDFGELPARTQRILNMFQIGDAEWRTLKAAEWYKGRDGDTFLVPAVVNDIPVDAIDKYADLTGKKEATQNLLKDQLAAEDKRVSELQEAATRKRIAAQDAEAREGKAYERVKKTTEEQKARTAKVERTYQDAELVVSGVETRAQAAKDRAKVAAEKAKKKALDAEERLAIATNEAAAAEQAAPTGEQLAAMEKAAKDDPETARLLQRARKAKEKADKALDRATAFNESAQTAWLEMEGAIQRIDDEYATAKEKAVKDAQRAQEARDQAVVMAKKADAEYSKAQEAYIKVQEKTRLAQMDEDDAVRRLNEVRKSPRERQKEIDERTDKALKDARDAARHQLAERLNAFYADRSRYAVLDIGVREKYALTGAKAADDNWGIAARVMGQFKSFMISQFLRTWGREWYGNEGLGKISGLVGFAVFSTVLGTMGELMRQYAKGEDGAATFANNPGGYLVKGFLRGGAASIMGDFAVGEFSRHGQTFGSYMMGPAGSLVDGVLQAKTAVQRGEDASGAVINTIKQHTPLQNFIWTKATLDFLVWNRLLEWSNPGYLQRSRRKQRENGTEFLFDGR